MKLLSVSNSSTNTRRSEAVFESSNGAQFRLHFETDASIASPEHEDHFFILGFVAAYLRSEPYTHPFPVDPRLFQNLHRLMEKWTLWTKRKPIEIHIPEFRPVTDETVGKVCGCLLTGGVDSLFTFNERGDKIGALVNVVHASNANSEPSPLKTETSLQAFSRANEKPLILVRTNMMTCFPEVADAWANLAHGPGYAAVGHFLSAHIDQILISSSFSLDQKRPWGSHPDTDHLLSSSGLAVEHFGVETKRFDKLRTLSKQTHFLKHLSVCQHGPQSSTHLNCSSCQKCIRAMIGLDLLGVRPDEAPTFDWSDYSGQKLNGFLLPGHVNCSEMLVEARRTGRKDIERVLSSAIDYSKRYHWIVWFEFFLRRHLAITGRHKKFFSRCRDLVYEVLKIKLRNHKTPSNT